MLNLILFNDSLSSKDAILIFLISVAVYFLSLTLHEFAHGFVAYKMGDNTPKVMGRLSLNPFRHLDPMGFLFFLIFGIGWAKPMPVNPLKFKKYRLGIRLTSIAGVLVNLALGLFAAVATAVLFATLGFELAIMNLEYLILVLKYIMIVNGFLFMFNILPIYPMDGFNFVTSFMKTDNKFIRYNLKNGFKIILTVLIVSALFDVMFNFDIFNAYLSLLYDYVFSPIVRLGV